MTVFELIGIAAAIDWASAPSTRQRLGLFSTREKAEARIVKIKENPEWRMDWDGFEIKEMEIE